MNLFKEKALKKQTSSKKIIEQQKKRIIQKANPSTQDTIKYVSQFEEGLMHVVGNNYSRMYQLGDVDYEVASSSQQEDIVMGYSNGLNVLDKNDSYQLLVLNKRVPSSELEQIMLPLKGDKLDVYRHEMNEIVENQFTHDEKNFVIEKYAIFSTKKKSGKLANKTLDSIAKNFQTRFDTSDVDIMIKPKDGLERLEVMNWLLRPGTFFNTTYTDIGISRLSSKSFIAPENIYFPKNKSYFRLGEKYASVLYIRRYPKNLEDILIREICNTGNELAISIHAKPYDMIDAQKNIQATRTINNMAIQKQQKENFKEGISEDMISGETAETKKSTQALLNEIKDYGQKLFSGIFAVYLVADTEDKLKDAVREVKDVGRTWQVEFDEVRAYKEEALNTILPLGKPYLDVEMNYMRDMTTTNITTQVPFTNVELQSPTGQYYGRNQRTNNMITVDRKRDLPTPSGLIFGTSGTGKGMITKWEIMDSVFHNPEDHHIIVDPESEYILLGRELGAEILDISTGTTHHLNILDMVDSRLLDYEDRNVDLVKEKANLLSGLFQSLLTSFTDTDGAIIDRVTRKTYEAFEDIEDVPTLVDWHKILCEQKGTAAEELAIKVEPYTIGSQDIFAHKTNIDMNAKFLLFNIKNLDERMKPFAMKVILDQIWTRLVISQGKVTTRLYFDELQSLFLTEESAAWFWNLWARIRKYGAIPTGITQNISTLLDSPAGVKMISNSEFMILLRQKPSDLKRLTEVVHLSDRLTSYIGPRIPKGTGLIYANGVAVPFENPIPTNTKLFELMNTDA